MLTRRKLTIVLAGTALTLFVWAHEGHHEGGIEAKGIRTDEKGRLVIDALARRALGLRTAEVELGAVEETATVDARVVVPWTRQTFASARLEGVVRELRALPGQTVAQGDILAVVESVGLLALRQELRQAEIEAQLGEENLRRVRELGESIVAGQEVLALEAHRDDRRSTVVTLERKLALVAPIGTATISVRAPAAGLVDAVDVVVGQHVAPREHLFHLQDRREVWVELQVPETLVGRVEPGQKVQIRIVAAPGRVFAGEVGWVELGLDPALHVLRAYVPLENDPPVLLPEMFGAADLVLQRRDDSFLAPREALVTDGAERYVLVQEEEGLYRKQAVVVGAEQGTKVEVREGLYPGDKVVTQGNHQLAALFVRGTLRLSEEARKTIALKLVEVDLASVDRVLVADARVAAPVDRRGLATARLEAKLERFHVALGARVERGQALAEVESLELQTLQLDLLQTSIQAGLVGKQLEALEQLARRGVSARKDLVRLRSEAAALGARLASLERRLLVMGLSGAEVAAVLARGAPQATVTLRAPIAGNVAAIRAVVGQVVHPGQAVLELCDPSQVWVEGAFFEADLPALLSRPEKKATLVTAVAHPARVWRSVLSTAGRSLSSAQVLAAWVEVPNREREPRLLPGMQARLTVVLETPPEKVIAVPLEAILAIGSRSYAFVEKQGGFRRVEVQLGRRDQSHAEVRSGLYPGDRVAVSGVNELNNALAALR